MMIIDRSFGNKHKSSYGIYLFEKVEIFDYLLFLKIESLYHFSSKFNLEK